MTSLAWRTLVLELSGFAASESNPRRPIEELQVAAEKMRLYLLGANSLAESLRNHAVVWTKAHSASAELAAAGPNVLIRRSVFGYSLLQPSGHSGVIHNLAGFMCFLIVKGSPRDIWSGTKVTPNGGEIKMPQSVNSWLMSDLLGYVLESANKRNEMSEIQRAKVVEATRNDSSAASLRFRELDKQMIVSD